MMVALSDLAACQRPCQRWHDPLICTSRHATMLFCAVASPSCVRAALLLMVAATAAAVAQAVRGDAEGMLQVMAGMEKRLAAYAAKEGAMAHLEQEARQKVSAPHCRDDCAAAAAAAAVAVAQLRPRRAGVQAPAGAGDMWLVWGCARAALMLRTST
jgi:hypothetical protein